MKFINTLLITIASIFTLVIANGASSNTFTISARDLDIIVRDSYAAGHDDAVAHYVREALREDISPTQKISEKEAESKVANMNIKIGQKIEEPELKWDKIPRGRL